MRISLLLLAVLATPAHAGPWWVNFDPLAMHRPLHTSDCPSDDCSSGSILRFGITRDVAGPVYVGGATGFMHIEAIAGARWISGRNAGLFAAAELRPTVEILTGTAIYADLCAGWAFELAHGHRFVVAPTFEAGPFWDRDHGRMVVVGGALDLAYGF